MSHLPPVTWNDIATRAAVDAAVDRLDTRLRREVQVLGSDLRRESVAATNRQIETLLRLIP